MSSSDVLDDYLDELLLQVAPPAAPAAPAKAASAPSPHENVPADDAPAALADNSAGEGLSPEASVAEAETNVAGIVSAPDLEAEADNPHDNDDEATEVGVLIPEDAVPESAPECAAMQAEPIVELEIETETAPTVAMPALATAKPVPEIAPVPQPEAPTLLAANAVPEPTPAPAPAPAPAAAAKANHEVAPAAPRPATPSTTFARPAPPVAPAHSPQVNVWQELQRQARQREAEQDPHRSRAEPTSRWLRMRCGAQSYALELLKVQEVVLPVPLLALRGTAHSMLGIMNLRGQVVPVIDLGLHLGSSAVVTDTHTRIVVLEENGDTMGLRVSAVDDVASLSDSQIEPPDTARICQISNDLFRGVARLGQQPMILLDAAKLLH